MDEEELKILLKDLKYGDVIKYSTKLGDRYLIVSVVDLKRKTVEGHMSSAVGSNSISIDELAKKEDLCFARWEKLK